MSDEDEIVFVDESYVKAMEIENEKLKKQIKFLQKDLKDKVSELNMIKEKK